MSRQEMAPYTKIASKARYSIKVVEPQEIEPQWCDLEFLEERNRKRTPAGKSIGKAVLKGMLERFQPSSGQSLPPECGALRREKSKGRNTPKVKGRATTQSVKGAGMPEYFGIDLDGALGNVVGLRDGLWAKLCETVAGSVEDKSLDLSRYTVPKPLHVTTFHCKDLKGRCDSPAILLESSNCEGDLVKLSIEAVAFIVGGLACAVVTRADPPVAAPHSKLFHVTLAVQAPWKPAQSNDLLHAMLTGSDFPPAVSGEVRDVKIGNGKHSLWCFRELDLSQQWHSGSVRVFERLEVCGRKCHAVLVRLPEALIISGPRFRHG